MCNCKDLSLYPTKKGQICPPGQKSGQSRIIGLKMGGQVFDAMSQQRQVWLKRKPSVIELSINNLASLLPLCFQ